MEPVTIEIDNLTVSFGSRAALRNVNARCRAGELTVIIGPSGSGKTTLRRAVNRLNELFPGCRTEGVIGLRLADRRVVVYGETIDVAELRRRAAMVFQSPNVLPVSIEKNTWGRIKAQYR